MTKWHKFSEELPPEGVEVIAYNMKWVDDDNKNGKGGIEAEYEILHDVNSPLKSYKNQ